MKEEIQAAHSRGHISSLELIPLPGAKEPIWVTKEFGNVSVSYDPRGRQTLVVIREESGVDKMFLARNENPGLWVEVEVSTAFK